MAVSVVILVCVTVGVREGIILGEALAMYCGNGLAASTLPGWWEVVSHTATTMIPSTRLTNQKPEIIRFQTFEGEAGIYWFS